MPAAPPHPAGEPQRRGCCGFVLPFHPRRRQKEEGEFCFMRRTRGGSSAFLLFKVRKEEAVEMGVGEQREVMGEG